LLVVDQTFIFRQDTSPASSLTRPSDTDHLAWRKTYRYMIWGGYGLRSSAMSDSIEHIQLSVRLS